MAWVENIVPRDILNASTSSSSFFSYLQLNLNDSFDRFFRLAVSLINFFFFFLNNYACSWWFFFFNFYSFFFFSLNSLANKKVFPFFLSMNTNLKIKYDKNGWSWLLESFFYLLGTWECSSSLHAYDHRRGWGESQVLAGTELVNFRLHKKLQTLSYYLYLENYLTLCFECTFFVSYFWPCNR